MESQDLSGQVAIVTGAGRGLGRAIAQTLLARGASVAICARSSAELENTAKELRSMATGSQKVFSQPIDVTNFAQVTQFIQSTAAELGTIGILVNNAGIYGPMGNLETIDRDEWQKTLQINLIGSMNFAITLIPSMKSNRRGKIIQLSGGGATRPLPGISAYAASKAAVVRLMETLAEEVRSFGIDINCVAPGALNTKMLDEVLSAGPEKVGAQYYAQAIKQSQEGGSPIQGATELIAYLASTRSDGLTGKLISAVWDPWQTLLDHKTELEKTDIYTLRRIIPQDRGFNW